jgi:hypothetical protein
MKTSIKQEIKASRKDSVKLSKSKKGFIFTILTLVIIVFMIIELNIYLRTYELKLAKEPDSLRLQVMQDFMRAYSPSKFNDTAYSYIYSALYKLNNDSVKNPPNSSTLADLVWNISYTGKRTDLAGQPALLSSGLMSYDSNLSALAKSMGIEITTVYYNKSISQADYWTVQYNFSMNVSIYDTISHARVNSSFPISLNISIIGFEDPWLARMNFTNRSIIPASGDPKAKLIATGQAGRGWFYGQPVVVTSCDNIGFGTENKTRIMVTDNDDVALGCGTLFGAVVLVQNSYYYRLNDIDIPSFANTSMTLQDVPSEPILIVSDSDSYTETGSSNYHYLINVTDLRNMIECGTYVKRPNNNYDYLSRLTNSIPGTLSEYGIETFVSGTSDKIKQVMGDKSFIDRSFNASQPGDVYKGLPGCSQPLICNYDVNNPGSNVPYPTRLDPNSARFYLGGLNDSMRK